MFLEGDHFYLGMSARRAPLKLYRKSEIGNCLTETLDELMNTRNLPEGLAWKVLDQFDLVGSLGGMCMFSCFNRRGSPSMKL